MRKNLDPRIGRGSPWLRWEPLLRVLISTFSIAEAGQRRTSKPPRALVALTTSYVNRIRRLSIVASITALLPAAGKVIAFLWLRENLPGRSRLVKGLWYGVLLTGMTDALIRVPFMSVVIGNPMDVMMVQSLEGWMIGPAMGIAIAM